MSRGKHVTDFTDSGWDAVPVPAPAPPAPAAERAPDSKAIDDGWGSTSAIQPLPKHASAPVPEPAFVAAPVVIAPASIPQAAAAPEPPREASPSSFSFVACERCGTTVRAAKFCECCGHPIRVAPPSFCPSCGASLRAGIRFCTNCAFPLT